jgi:nucleoside-diphosphate-sugar epimerase
LAELCIALLDSPSRIEFSGQPDPDDRVTWEVSIEKAQRAFGYAPRVTIEDSILRIADAVARSRDAAC